MAGLENHSVGGNVKRDRVDLLKGPDDRGNQVRTTANRFSNDNIRSAVFTKPLDGSGEFVEVAAKTGASNFPYIESLGTQKIRVDQISGLIIGNDGNTLSLRLIVLSQA